MPTDQGRMTGTELLAALDVLEITRGFFARLLVRLGAGTDDKNMIRLVYRWSQDKQDVPTWVPVVLQILILYRDATGAGPAELRGWLDEAVDDETEPATGD